MKKFLCFLLAILMILPLAAACSEEPAPEAPPADNQPPASPEVEELKIIDNGVCHVYYDRSTIKNITPLTDALSEKLGVEVEAQVVYANSKGSSVDEIEENAILVGNVLMPDGWRSAGGLRVNDCAVGIYDGHFILGGKSSARTEEAVNYFISMVLSEMGADNTLTFKREDNYRKDAKYSLGDISIGGKSLGHYKVQVASDCSISEWRTAVLLRQFVSEKIGYELELIEADSCNAPAVIRIGSAVCDSQPTAQHEYTISINGTTVELVAESLFGYTAIQRKLSNDVLYSTDRTGVKALDNASSIAGDGATYALSPMEINGDVRIMYNNIHGQIENGTMPVQQPTEMLVELYLEYLPDVIGLQECTSHSFNAGIVKLLSSEYDMVYDKQTATAMFYRRETVELLDSGYYGFNDIDAEFADENHIYKDLIEDRGYATTDIYYNNTNKAGQTGQSRKDGSKGVTWGIFRLKSTGNVFMAGSTHLWWENNEALDDITRMVQMRKLRNVTTEAAAAFAAQNGIEAGTIPIFIGGDYNTEYGGNRNSLPTMESTVNSYAFSNVNRIATQKLETTTHHAYATYDKDLDIYVNTNPTNRSYEYAIDHIFVNNAALDMITANFVDRLEDDYAYLASDHLAIFTDVTFNASAPKTN